LAFIHLFSKRSRIRIARTPDPTPQSSIARAAIFGASVAVTDVTVVSELLTPKLTLNCAQAPTTAQVSEYRDL
jgi:hypothetical protein